MQASIANSSHPSHGHVVLSGEIDNVTADAYANAAATVIRSSPGLPWVSLDLSAVTFMDCRGIAMLLAIRQAALTAGTRVILAGVSARVSRVLTITGVDALFVDEAAQLPG